MGAGDGDGETLYDSLPRTHADRRTDRGLFGDALATLDRSVGEVFHAFAAPAIANNTLTVFR